MTSFIIALIASMAIVACVQKPEPAGRTDQELARICSELGTAVSSIEHERCMEVLRHEY